MKADFWENMPSDQPVRRAAVGIALLALLATVQIALTYRQLNQVIDEPAHIGAGMEWLALVVAARFCGYESYGLRRRGPQLLAALAVFGIVVWGGYRFENIDDERGGPDSGGHVE